MKNKFNLLIFIPLILVGIFYTLFLYRKSGYIDRTQNNNDNNKLANLCPEKIEIPQGFYLQEPLNSFFGLTLKDGQGLICFVLLSPQYDQYRNNLGDEQIQINVYSGIKTNKDEIMKNDSIIRSMDIKSYKKYYRNSYGGQDAVIIFDKDDRIFQLIWRENSSTAVNKNVLDLVQKLQK